MNAVPPWRVVKVTTLPGYRLDVCFQDGTAGLLDLAGLVTGEDAGVFAALREPGRFDAVHIDHGALSWPGEIDLAPDALYAEIKKNGCCVLT